MNEEFKKIYSRIEDLERRVKTIEGITQTSKKSIINEYSNIKAFFNHKNPSNETLRTLTAGYYLEKIEKFKSFNIEDLKIAYRMAKEVLPKNISDSIYRNLRKKHMKESSKKDGRKSWVLTRYGEQFVENNFEK